MSPFGRKHGGKPAGAGLSEEEQDDLMNELLSTIDAGAYLSFKQIMSAKRLTGDRRERVMAALALEPEPPEETYLKEG